MTKGKQPRNQNNIHRKVDNEEICDQKGKFIHDCTNRVGTNRVGGEVVSQVLEIFFLYFVEKKILPHPLDLEKYLFLHFQKN